MQLEEPKDLGHDGSATPDAPADGSEASLHKYEAAAADNVGPVEPARPLKAEMKANYEKKMAAHREEQQWYIREMTAKAQQDFD